MCIHKLAYAGHLHAYAYFEPTCAYQIMRVQTCLNPNPETNKEKNKAEKKNPNSNNLACL